MSPTQKAISLSSMIHLKKLWRTTKDSPILTVPTQVLRNRWNNLAILTVPVGQSFLCHPHVQSGFRHGWMIGRGNGQRDRRTAAAIRIADDMFVDGPALARGTLLLRGFRVQRLTSPALLVKHDLPCLPHSFHCFSLNIYWRRWLTWVLVGLD